ncbi:MAG: hypothetical protein ACE5JG_09275 [Planctomycetota bacterium]
MRRTGAFCSLLLLAAGAAIPDDQPTTAVPEPFRRAVAAQKGLVAKQIRDVYIHFIGHLRREGEHSISVEYWYRAADRSFRIRTASRTRSSEFSERGIFGERRFWERRRDGSVRRLFRTHRQDEQSIHKIQRDREDFEALRGFLFLRELQGPKTRYRLVSSAPVSLDGDHPRERGNVLGKSDAERKGRRYHRVDVFPEGRPRLRLFVREGPYTVHKVIVYDREAPDRPAGVYYLGAYSDRTNPMGALLPQVFAYHRQEPRDPKTGLESSVAWGRIREVGINRDPSDGLFQGKPAGG